MIFVFKNFGHADVEQRTGLAATGRSYDQISLHPDFPRDQTSNDQGGLYQGTTLSSAEVEYLRQMPSNFDSEVWGIMCPGRTQSGFA